MDGEDITRLPLRENVTGQGLLLVTLALLALGAVTVFSTTAGFPSKAAWYDRPDARQAMFGAGAFLLLLVLWRMDYHWLARRPWPGRKVLGRVPAPATVLLGVALTLSVLVMVPGVGHEVGGQRRWFRLGALGFQPSEVLKFSLLIYLAAFLSRREGDPKSFRRTFLPLAALAGASVAVVVKYNFSTAALIGLAAGCVLLMGGVRWCYLASLVALGAGLFYAFVVSDPRRMERITAFLNPMNTTNPAAYQPAQSLMWISSGANPAGLGGGVAKFGYLPEDDTDFIFTTLCHETGLAGALLVIALVLAWLFLARRAVVHAPDRLGALLAGGVGLAVCLQAAMHIAVTQGWLPPTGISLPFVSVGGTGLLIMSAATALVVSVTARRKAAP